ncbi:MAG: transposase, partial [Bacteroidota bacterium]
TKKSGIIVAAQNFQGNPHDNKTLIPLLLQYHRIQGKLPKVGIVDRGFRGPKEVFTMKVLSPDKPKKSKTPYQKRKARQQFRRRAAIEPIIGHLKNRFRLSRNWLKGAKGDRMNLILAAAAFNFKKWMNKAIQPLFELFFALIFESGSRQRQLERYS